MLHSDLLARALQLSPKLVTCRRHLHANPELSFKEHETQDYVLKTLGEFGIEQVERIAGTGVLATISGAAKGKCIALRGDMDALPIQEVEGRTYGSLKPGIMHACGHDVHTTCALGAAVLLHESRANWKGTVKVIFQPGEELLPGGATKVIADGVLLAPDVESIVALHVAPDLEVGKFGIRSGSYMASADELYLTLNGEGGHAAMAHKYIDLIATSSQLYACLQAEISKAAPPEIPTVLRFGKIDSVGGATNVLASQVSLAGTFRTYDELWRKHAHEIMSRTASSVAQLTGASIDLEIRKGYPALSNDLDITQQVRKALSVLVGERHLEQLEIRPTAEDFAWYLQHVPGCFFRLGVRNEKLGITAGVHQANFDVDERCLPLGAAGLAGAAITLLGD